MSLLLSPVPAAPEALVDWLFMDMNSYFASVEQETRPELRGAPVAVVQLAVDNACCIAVSYEAKASGVKTGTLLKEARQLCPGLKIAVARHELYAQYHHKVRQAVEECLPVTVVISVDEMACRLIGRERFVPAAMELARKVKHAIRERVGRTLRCSVGLAPNRFLAKVASDMQKPDGLTVITRADIPTKLYALKPEDLPGIGRRMNKRLEGKGILTMEQLFALSPQQMRHLWAGVGGERLWHWMRGDDFDLAATVPRSIGHQHVLAPELRSRELACAVCQKLLHRAGARLRKQNMWAGGLAIFVVFMDDVPAWESHVPILESQDTMSLLEIFHRLWQGCPCAKPIQVGVTLYALVPDALHSLTLMQEEEQRRIRLASAMDRINGKYKGQLLYFGGIHDVRSAAPTRISFTNIPEDF